VVNKDEYNNNNNNNRPLQMRLLAGTASDVCWSRIHLHCLTVLKHLAYWRCFRMIRSINWLICLLTYLLTGLTLLSNRWSDKR